MNKMLKYYSALAVLFLLVSHSFCLATSSGDNPYDKTFQYFPFLFSDASETQPQHAHHSQQGWYDPEGNGKVSLLFFLYHPIASRPAYAASDHRYTYKHFDALISETSFIINLTIRDSLPLIPQTASKVNRPPFFTLGGHFIGIKKYRPPLSLETNSSGLWSLRFHQKGQLLERFQEETSPTNNSRKGLSQTKKEKTVHFCFWRRCLTRGEPVDP